MSFIGVVALIDYDGGQYVLLAFMLCILVVSTVFTFPSRLLPKELGGFCDVAHVVRYSFFRSDNLKWTANDKPLSSSKSCPAVR